MTSEREDTPPSGISTLTPLAGPNLGELPPIIASTFTIRSPKNTLLTNRASTSANRDPVISPTFMEANYKVFASHLRDRRRQVRNEDLHTELDYYSEEYDEEREIESSLIRARETTLVLRTGSPLAFEMKSRRWWKSWTKPSSTTRSPPVKNQIDRTAGGKLRDKNAKESWEIIENLALYDHEGWNDPRDFAKPVKAISLPRDVPSTSDCRLIELENQVQRLMGAHLAHNSSVQVNKIASSCEIYSGPHNTQYCMENPEQADWEMARDAELNPFKDVLVFRRMVEFLGAITINIKGNMWESKVLVDKRID
ncbi:hypothetical protein Tco_0060020 [Tanacetum coccineum]